MPKKRPREQQKPTTMNLDMDLADRVRELARECRLSNMEVLNSLVRAGLEHGKLVTREVQFVFGDEEGGARGKKPRG
jgi:hypothetical protein